MIYTVGLRLVFPRTSSCCPPSCCPVVTGRCCRLHMLVVIGGGRGCGSFGGRGGRGTSGRCDGVASAFMSVLELSRLELLPSHHRALEFRRVSEVGTKPSLMWTLPVEGFGRVETRLRGHAARCTRFENRWRWVTWHRKREPWHENGMLGFNGPNDARRIVWARFHPRHLPRW